MKKTRTLIMLLLVFILTAAFGKEAQASGSRPKDITSLGPAQTDLEFHYDALSNMLQWKGKNTSVYDKASIMVIYVWRLTSSGDYGDLVMKRTLDITTSLDHSPDDGIHAAYPLSELEYGKYGAAVVFENGDRKFIARTPLIKFTIFAPGECWHLNATGGSTWSAWKTTRNATCEKDGQESRTCSQCGKTETRTIKKLGHNWGSWQTSKKATCTAQGQETRKCSRCGKTETRTTKALGHSWGSWKESKKASCFAEGEERRQCSRCNKEESRAIPKTAHKWGDWYTIIEPSHGERGMEERRCMVCQETEKRDVEGDEPLAGPGDSGIYVVIAQELLKVGYEYSGPCDGIFNDALAEAIKTYELSAMGSMAETGVIYKDTLQCLSERFYYGEFDCQLRPIENTGFFFQESGLRVDPLLDCGYTDNGNGTHEVEPAVFGLIYSNWKGEKAEFRFPNGARYDEEEPYNASCRMDGGKPVCKDCGADLSKWMAQTVEVNIDDILAHLDFSGGVVITSGFLDKLDYAGLPLIDGLYYSEDWNSVYWKDFDQAEDYDLWLVSLDKDDKETLVLEEKAITYTCFDFPALEAGRYVAAVQAKDKDGKSVSDPTKLAFLVSGKKMPIPREVQVYQGGAMWLYDAGNVDPIFHFTMRRVDGGKNETVYETETENRYVDLTQVLAKLAVEGLLDTEIIYEAAVYAEDANGKLDNSAEEAWPFFPTAPDFYRVLCAVNVRRGPGKNYERIGSYSKGVYISSFDTVNGDDGTYVVVNYKGEPGYILSSCLTWFSPKYFSVHVDLGDGQSVEVYTNLDGTIDQTDLMNKVSRKGYRLGGLKQTVGEGKGTIVNPDKVLQPGDAFEAVWGEDPDYVFVRFVDENGDPVKVYDYSKKKYELTDKIPIRIGTTYRIRTNKSSGKAIGWRWYSNDKEYIEVSDGTPFTAQMTKLVCYEKQSVTLGKKTVTGRPERFLYLYDSFFDIEGLESLDDLTEKMEKIGRLQEGDVLTFQGMVDLTNEWRMYLVHVDRLNKDGYIYGELLDGLDNTEWYNIYFDADGGRCPVGYMLAKVQAGYSYPTLTELPVPSRSGSWFVGWEDAKGNPVKAGYEFTGSVKLKAKWVSYSGGMEVKTGVTISLGDGALNKQTRPYGLETPASKNKIELPVGEEVQVIGKAGDFYQCVRDDHSVVWVEKRFIATDYTKYILTSMDQRDFYLDAKGNERIGEIVGNNTGKCYVLGEKGGYWKVAVPENELKSGKTAYTSGVGWIKEPYTARYKANYAKCRVIFCPGEGVTWLDQTEVWVGERIPAERFPIPCLSGYEFEGWYTDPELGELVTTATPITKNMTLYAHYKDLYDDYEAATEKAPIYDRTSTAKGKVIGYVDIGEVVIVQYESKQGKFAWVSHDGVSGWVQTKYLKAGVVREARGDYKEDRAIRSKAQYKKGTVYRNVESGELFLSFGSENSYYKVAYPCEAGYAYIAIDQMQKR